jgi:hypothetical protein
MFHAVDGLLYLDAQCLMQVVPNKEEVTENDILRSTCRMHAESLDFSISVDRRYMMSRIDKLISLAEAIAFFVAKDAVVELLQRDAGDPMFSCKQGGRFNVMSKWSLRNMLVRDPIIPRAKALESALRIYDSCIEDTQMDSHTYVVKGLSLPNVLIPLTQWIFITRHDNYTSRFSILCDDSEQKMTVNMYRNGLLEDHETVHDTSVCIGWTINLDIHATRCEIPDSTCGAELEHFSRIFLRSDRAVELSRSKIVRTLLKSMHPWKTLLRNMWCIQEDQHIIDIVCSDSTHDELVQLANVNTVLHNTAYSCDDIDMIGLAVLRRMRPIACSRVAEWRATAVSEHSIIRFKMLPTTSERLKHLYEIGALDSISEHSDHACAYGFIVGEGYERIVAVPYDVDARLLTMALVQMLPYEVHIPSTILDIITLSFEVLHCESSAACIPNECLRPYRISASHNGLTLSTDKDSDDVFVGDGIVAVDMMQRETVSRCETRVCKATLSQLFPKLAQRLQVSKDPVTACMREVQSRRVCSEWTLEGIDEGSNLSSLGLSVTMALALGLWIGAQVRLFMSRTQASMIGYWDATSECYKVIDPTRTVLNGFDVAPHLLRARNCEVAFDIKRQSFLEVRQRTTWHVAIVTSVDKALQTVQVRFLLSGKVTTLCLRQHAWRRLARCSDTDVDKVLRRYISSAAAAAVSSQEVHDLPQSQPDAKRSRGEPRQDDTPSTSSSPSSLKPTS